MVDLQQPDRRIDRQWFWPRLVPGGGAAVFRSTLRNRLGLADVLEPALRNVFLEYSELLLFLLVAMTYVNALEERRVFDVLRAALVRAGLSYRALFWATGGLAFAISPVADNLTTALVMSAVAIALGREAPRFVALSCINIVVAANAGGASSPFGDIATLS